MSTAVLVLLSPYVDDGASSVVMTILVQDDVTVPTKELAPERRLDFNLLRAFDPPHLQAEAAPSG